MDTATIMATIALLVAIASAWYSRRLASVEADRRHDERTPRFSLSDTATPVRHPDGRQLLLTVLTNDGPQDLDEVHLELVEGGPITGITLNQRGSDVSRRVMAGAFRLGASKTLLLEPTSEDASGRVRIRFRACKDGQEWHGLLVTEKLRPPRIW